MKLEEIIEGHCYINNRKRTALVRKVTSIDSLGKVHYNVLSGPILKRRNDGCCRVENFARWAESVVEELEDYSYLKGFVPYKNYSVLSVHGYELMKCQERKVNFYLRKGLMEWVDEDTLQFTTDEVENKLLKYHGGTLPEYFLEEKNKFCVVCGTDRHLTKHHVVPKKDLIYYPLSVKENFCNLLPICHKHHKEYEKLKGGVEFSEYNFDSALRWKEHFIETMEPKHMPNGWDILTGLALNLT